MSLTIKKLIKDELTRQEHTISLIASENYASSQVLSAAGSALTNKYAEGFPGRRYYAGCSIVDKVEEYACDLAKELFSGGYANVQPHSGANANLTAYLGLLQPGDTVLAMSLNAGGHLTHGYNLNFSAKFYNFVHYGVNKETELLDYEQLEQLAAEHKPKLIVAGASSYARIIDYGRIATIARTHGALLMVDMAHVAGLIATGHHPSPIPYADVVTSTTHKTLRGPRGGLILAKSGLGESIDRALIPGSQGGPLMHIIAAKAVAFEEALQPGFAAYSEQTIKNAQSMAKTFQDLGYRLVSGGTDNHLFMIDLRGNKHAIESGKEAEELLESCGIVVNRNAIPYDTKSPKITSGIRIGTPAITTRGMKEAQAEAIALWIDQIFRFKDQPAILSDIRKSILTLCKNFPVYKKDALQFGAQL